MAKPSEVIEADAFAAVDGAPAIVAGVVIESTVISPRTVKVLFTYCK